MLYSIQNQKIAREMRLSGKSLSEIHIQTNIPVSTLSNWFRDITLTKEQLVLLGNRVAPKMSRGRMNSGISLKAQRMVKERRIFEDAVKEFSVLCRETMFIAGLSLYWAHGASKSKHFQFTNSDKDMISLMRKWIIKYLKMDESLIKEREYDGYKRIVITRIDVLRKVIAWQKLLIKYYSEVSQ